MEFLSENKEVYEIENKTSDENKFDEKTLDKYDKILGDDNIEIKSSSNKASEKSLSSNEIQQKFNELFNFGDFFETVDNMNETQVKEYKSQEVYPSDENNDIVLDQEEPKYDLEEDLYETDENGVVYKKNGELLPNVEYLENNHKYTTDESGRIKSCDGTPKYTDEGSRNIKEQKEAGGDERKYDDDGGHIIAKILNGSEGCENLVPMRRTINRGDYKKMENEIAKALQDGKEVSIHIDIEYDGDSKRPSIITSKYSIDDEKTIVKFDNRENSIELLDLLKDKINDKDYQSLKDEIDDMKEDGVEASITSIKTQYDKDGNSTKITVGILDESSAIKTYKVYEAKQEELN